MIIETLQTIVTTAFKDRNAADAISAEQILIAEARLGLGLPEALTDYYTVAGTHAQMMEQDFHLLPREKLRVEGSYLIFCDEQQWAAAWGIHQNNLASANPSSLSD